MNSFFKLLLLLSAFLNVFGINLFLIGDSFDRYWVHEWCEDKQSTYHSYTEKSNYVFPYVIVWGDSILDPGHHNSPLFCRDTELNDTIAQIQIYGSNMTGPYHDGYDGPVKNTINRVKLGLQGYFDLLDTLPDRIMIHTTQWDVAYLCMVKGTDFGPTHPDYVSVLAIEEKRVNELIDYVQHIVNEELKRRQKLQDMSKRRALHSVQQHQQSEVVSGYNTQYSRSLTAASATEPLITTGTDLHKEDSEWYSDREKVRQQAIYNKLHNITEIDYYSFKVEIGLRSTTRRIENPSLILDFNAINRRIAQQRNLTFYDFDYDFWSSVDFHRTDEHNKNLFRDEVHPAHSYSIPIVNKILLRQCTQYFSQQGGNVTHAHIFTHHSELNSDRYKHMNFQLLRMYGVDKRTENHTQQQIIHNIMNNVKNQLIQPITDVANTSFINKIPGHGPLYYSMIVNGTRVKWLVTDLSARFYFQLQYEHNKNNNGVSTNVTSATHHHIQHKEIARRHKAHLSVNSTRYYNPSQTKVMTNSQYELSIRPILETLQLPTSDLVLLSVSLLDTIPTLGVMPNIYDNTKMTAFTSINEYNSSEMNLYLVSRNHDIHKITPQSYVPAFMEMLSKQKISIIHNLDQLFVRNMPIVTSLIPNIFHDNALIRFHTDKSVYCVLDYKRHAFSGLSSFISRGFDFSDVIVYDATSLFWVELLPIGDVLM